MNNLNKRNIVPIIILILAVGCYIYYTGVRYLRGYQYQGQWETFDSQEYHQVESFPDGFRLDYPLSWGVATLESGGTKNLRELRVEFTRYDFIFWPKTGLNIWWRRVDENWTLDDARNWFVEEIPFGLDSLELQKKQDTFRETTIGAGHYPALTQIFTEFSGKNPREQVVLLVVGDEAFAFSFHTNNYDEETQQIFKRMLDSLEIYE